jgi:hypothetical protein
MREFHHSGGQSSGAAAALNLVEDLVVSLAQNPLPLAEIHATEVTA